MSLVVVNRPIDGVVVSETEFREILTDLDLYKEKLEGLLRVVMRAYAVSSRTPEGARAFKSIEHWIHDNYLELRERLPPELKRLYLHDIAFPPRHEPR